MCGHAAVPFASEGGEPPAKAAFHPVANGDERTTSSLPIVNTTAAAGPGTCRIARANCRAAESLRRAAERCRPVRRRQAWERRPAARSRAKSQSAAARCSMASPVAAGGRRTENSRRAAPSRRFPATAVVAARDAEAQVSRVPPPAAAADIRAAGRRPLRVPNRSTDTDRVESPAHAESALVPGGRNRAVARIRRAPSRSTRTR